MPTVHITKGFIEKVKPPMDRVQNLYWDSELKGFGLLVGKNTKTFVVQKSGGRRITSGRYGVFIPAQARKKALEKLAAICNGIISQAPSITLLEVHQLHKESMVRKNFSPRSIEDGNYRLKKYLSDWSNRPFPKLFVMRLESAIPKSGCWMAADGQHFQPR